MDYSTYTEEDFILDESFHSYVFGKKPADVQFWENWIAAHPQKKDTVENAARFLKSLQLNETTFEDHETVQSWQLVQQQIRQTPLTELTHPASQQPIQPYGRKYWVAAAAAFAGLLLVSVWLLWQKNSTIKHQTAYGETKSILLPDSSTITLNANSTLSYKKGWNSRQAREVWLDGEAFLQVVKKPGAVSAKFVVHTDNVQVEVLGTAFNVNSRRGKTQVVLNSGKVQLKPEELTQTEALVMMPGEMAEFREEAKTFTKQKVNPELYTSWRNHKFIFNDISLEEIARLLEDTYGLEVVIQDKQLLTRKLTGEIASTDESTVLEVLEESLHIQISKQGRTLIVTNY